MPVPIRITFRKAAHTEALLDGRVTSSRLNFQFTLVEPISGAFRRAIRNEEFDVSEMALVTLAMARDFGKPWLGLPLVVARNFHHGAMRTHLDSVLRGPEDLVGKRVGVRAYSQTTGVWVRGILKEEYSVPFQQVMWLTTEDAHVSEYQDPAWVHRLPAGANLGSMLRAGELDAIIGDSKSAFGETRSVIPEPQQAAAAWFQKTGLYPVNHVIAVRSESLSKYPWLAQELQMLFLQARQIGQVPEDLLPYGPIVNRMPIDRCLQYASEQDLTRKAYRYDDLFVS